MRIGIITYHFANNYGAVLQAYCLQKVLEKNGIEIEFIDYQSKLQTSNNSIFLENDSIKNEIKNFVRLPYYKSRKERILKFIDFKKKYLNITKEKFVEQEEVIKFVEQHYDALIVGSDQIWNPLAPDFDEIYFKISQAKIPVYAYAASLGTANENEISRFKNDILNFLEVSVREETSIDILRRVSPKICAKGVLDPTLLVKAEIIKKIAKKPAETEKDYIVCYYLGRNKSIKFRKTINKLAKQFGIKAYYINANYGIAAYGKNVISNCGPEEFLGYLMNAKFVCTNSFHAIALSIQFSVPFFCFEKANSKDTRKIDLLRRLKIEERVVYDFEISNIKEYKMPYIDYEEKIQEYRKESLDFLKCITEDKNRICAD